MVGKSENNNKTNWDFKGHNTQYMTHGIHKYPARMIPQIAKRLILEFSQEGDLVIDPFAGSGTVVTEALINNRRAIGSDLNPLALLINKVRTKPINDKILKEVLDKIKHEWIKNKKYKKIKISEDININYWFKDKAIDGLSRLKSVLTSLDLPKDQKDFFDICFSYTVRNVSNLRQGEYKIYRIPKNKLILHNANVFNIFLRITLKYIDKMSEFYKYISSKNIKRNIKILKADARSLPKKIYKNNLADLIVTSPPYGDSRTTVAYGQFSRYSLAWLGFAKKEIYDIDKILLGGRPTNFIKEIKSPTLQKILKEIQKRDPSRAKDTLWFMTDLYMAIKEMGRILKKGGYACIVIGDRSVSRIRVPTSKIIEEIAVHIENYRFKHIITIGRNIPNKNNPTASKFKLADGSEEWIKTMNKENIVILKKR